MKRLIIIVEGDTELEFIKTIMIPYLNQNGILNISAFKIKHSRGGLTKYEHLKKDILNCIHHNDVIITTLIDYYGLPKDFPNYLEIKNSTISSKEKVEKLEQAIKNEIESSKKINNINFLPYIQLHEFEALIFSNVEIIKKIYESYEFDYKELDKIVNQFPNPEDINDSVDTAPSKRLKSINKAYNKVIDGNIILNEIGIKTILTKCPRFNNWVNKIIELLT